MDRGLHHRGIVTAQPDGAERRWDVYRRADFHERVTVSGPAATVSDAPSADVAVLRAAPVLAAAPHELAAVEVGGALGDPEDPGTPAGIVRRVLAANEPVRVTTDDEDPGDASWAIDVVRLAGCGWVEVRHEARSLGWVARRVPA